MDKLLLSHWRYLWRHRLQTSLAIIGIALGVTVVVAVDLTNDSANRSFRLSYQRVMGSASHHIVGGRQGVSEATYHQLRMKILPYYADIHAAPVIQTYVNLAEHPQRILQLLAIDPVAETPFRRYINQGLDGTQNLTTAFMLQPNTALLSATTAEQLGIDSGHSLAIEHNGHVTSLKIIGVMGNSNDYQYNNLLVMDIGNAQQMFGREGYLDRIDLRTDINASKKQIQTFLQQLSQQLPAELRIEATEAGQRSTLSLTESFQLNLQALSLLTLMVGLFLIYNTMHSFVMQRRLLMGRLRALGVLQQQIYRAILSEALILGFIGTLIGLPLGLYLATFLLELASQTINDHYYVTTVNRLFFSPVIVFKGISLGLLVTVIAAWAPAYRAARIPPAEQLQRISQERPQWQRSVRVFALVLLVSTGIATAWYNNSGVIGGFVAIFCLLMVSALLTPQLLQGLTWLLARLMPQRKVLAWNMAVRDTRRNLSRTGVAAMALLVAVTSTNGIGVMVASFRDTLALWLQARVNAEAYVRPAKSASIHQQQFVPPTVIVQLQQYPGIADLSLFVDFPVTLSLPDGPEQTFTAQLTAAALPAQARRGYQFLPQWPPRQPIDHWHAFDRGELLISETLANKRQLAVGDALILLTDRGPASFTIGGIYYDYGSEHGRILLQHDQLQNHWHNTGIETVGLYLDLGGTPDVKSELLNQLLRTLPATPPLLLFQSQDVVTLGLGVFDRTFAITHALRLLALCVAMVGIFSALSSLQLERLEELYTLRSLGFTRSQITTQQLTQAGLLGLFVGLLAIPLGQALAWVLINVVNLRAFGWSMTLQPQWATCLENLLLATAASLVASVYPTWRSGRKTTRLGGGRE